DMAKEKISDKRKDLQLLIKLKSDTQSYDAKLKRYLDEINSIKKSIEGFDIKELILQQDQIANLFQDGIFQDYELIKDKINISEFGVIDIPENSYSELKINIERVKDEIVSLNSSLVHKEAEFHQINNDIKSHNDEIVVLEDKIQQFKLQISSFDEKLIPSLKGDKLAKQSLSEDIFNKYDKSIFEKKGYKVVDIYDMEKIIDEIIGDGKNLKLQLDNVELQEKNLITEIEKYQSKMQEFELKEGTKYYAQLQEFISQKKRDIVNEIEKIKLKQSYLGEKKLTINGIYGKISLLDKSIEGEKIFLCEKIGENCPYIDIFKKDSIKTISSQKDILQKELESIYPGGIVEIDKQIELFGNEINDLEKNLSQIDQNSDKYLTNFYKTYEQEKTLAEKEINDLKINYESKNFHSQKKQLEDKISDLKEFLASLDWKSVKDGVLQVKTLQQEINEFEKRIGLLEQQEKKISQYKEQLINHTSQLDSLNKQILILKEKSLSIEEAITSLKDNLKSKNLGNINSFMEYLEKFMKIVNSTNEMIIEFKQLQLEVSKFKEDEKIYGDLFNVFSKELMRVVLEQFLPSLTDAINNYLVQIVDYTLKFDLVKKPNDKLELEIQVHDEKGVRPVKSLSGGQKTVLKLIWILAVSSIMKSKFLFLDETINNLDYDTIGRVADVIEDFVNSSDVKFYVVTHSKQIQDMNIWDGVIDFNIQS
ncbi:MAG: hypothetical protein V3575_01175, partial [Candidatus Absconditabacteria bacterium]